jgi:tRNA A-37 threonylcarbamoyl transferase component Bud32
MGDLQQPIPGYEVQELIGSGGMSSVYRARHKGLDRLVALKVLRREQIDPGLALQRLMKEARVLSRLDHPNIVRSIDYGEAGELVYFVMELVDGRSCKQVLIDRGPFPLREVLLIGEKVALALGHAAAHGVIHRDVKPGNILLAKDGAVKLTDFGLARATRDRSLTQDGITVGTPQYMSPEQVRTPRRVDLRSDLYSLGATLYHLVTGHPPLRGETVGEILHDVLYALPKPPEQLVPGLPPGLSRLLARLLAKDPRRRYPSAEELIADLKRVRAAFSDPDADLEVGLSWQEAAEPPPRRLAGGWLAGAAALLAVGAFLVPWRCDGGQAIDLNDAAVREEALLASLAADWRDGRRSSAEIILRIDELRRDGQFTPVSGLARIDLLESAAIRLTTELAGAAAAGRAAWRTTLARGDFAAAAAAADLAFEAAVAAVVAKDLLPRLASADVDVAATIAVAKAELLSEQQELERDLRQRLRKAVSGARLALDEQVQADLQVPDFAAARARIAGHAAREAADGAAAVGTGLEAAGVSCAAVASPESFVRGWPASLREVIEREPAASFAAEQEELVAERVQRGVRDLRFDASEAVRDALLRDESGEAVDPAAVRSAFDERHVSVTQALAAIEALPPEIEAGFSGLVLQLGATALQRAEERATAARRDLLDGDSARPGIVELLSERRFGDAAAAVAAAEGLLPAERAEWQRTLLELRATLDAALADLRRRAGGEVDVRDRRGIGIRGRLVLEADGHFSVGSRTGLTVEDLAATSLEPALEAAILDPARRLLARGFLGDARDRQALAPEFERLAGSPVADALRRATDDRARGDAVERAGKEASATAWRAQLDAALAAGEVEKARAAWRELVRLKETAAGKAALSERKRIDDEIEALARTARTRALLDEVGRRATERVVEADGRVRLTYEFDDVAEAEDWQFGSSIRVDNGKLVFSGGEEDWSGALYGASRSMPFDRREPASLEVRVMATLGEKRPPRWVALRLGGGCAGFFRPRPPIGQEHPPQLVAWSGTLDEKERLARFFDPELGQLEPAAGSRVVPVGLERGYWHVLMLEWLPDPDRGLVRLVVRVDGEVRHQVEERLAAPRARDIVQLLSLTEVQFDRVVLRGKLDS